MNINDFVYVQLTSQGKSIYFNRYSILPKESESGWCRFQLWNLMNLFGEHIYLGGDIYPFKDNEILFNNPDDL